MGSCTSCSPNGIGDVTICGKNYDDVVGITSTFGDDYTLLNPVCSTYLYPTWQIDTESTSPNDWAIELGLNSPYQFDSAFSGFEFSVFGACLDSDECDLFWGFGDGQKYFTFLTNLDGHSWASDAATSGSFIYPQCGGALATGDVSTALKDSSLYDATATNAIRDALAGGNRSNWHLLSPLANGNDFYPLHFRVFNDISSNRVKFIFNSSTLTLSCEFDGSFEANTDLIFSLQSDVTAGTANDMNINSIGIES